MATDPTSHHPELNDPAWLQARADERYTRQALADLIGCSQGALNLALRRHGISTRGRRYPQLADPDWLRAQADLGRTTDDIANEVGCGPSTVQRAYRLLEPPDGVDHPLLNDPGWLRTQAQQHRTADDIATELGCPPDHVATAYARHKLVPGWERHTPTPPPWRARLDDRAWLAERLEAGDTLEGLAVTLGCSATAVHHAIHKHELASLTRDVHALRYPELYDRAWLVAKTAEGACIEDITELLGCATETVRKLTGDRFPTRHELATAPLDDPIWLQNRIDDGESNAAIARHLGVASSTVDQARQRHGITPAPRTPPELDDPAWLAIQFDEGRSIHVIAAHLGCSERTVELACSRHGVQPDDDPRLNDRAWLQAQADAGRTRRDVANELGCPMAALQDKVTRLNVRGFVDSRVRYPQLSDPDWLQAQADAGRPRQRIADELGCSIDTVTKAYRRANLTPAPAPAAARHPELSDPSWFQAQVDAGRTPEDIADEYGIKATTVVSYAASVHVSFRRRHALLDDHDWLATQRDAGRTLTQIARDANTTISRVRTALARAGLTRPARRSG